jgi:hypothetical protein
MSPNDLLQHVPPAARYRYEPLNDDQNAVSYWSEAVAALGKFDESLDDCLYSHLDAEDGDGQPRPLDESEIMRLRRFVEDNRPVFELLRAGVQCGKVQFHAIVDDEGSVAEHAEPLSLLRDLAKSWLALARVRIAEGRFADAARELADLGEMGHMLCCGESFQLQYLIGSAVMGIAHAGIDSLVAEHNPPAGSLDGLIAAVDHWIAESDQAVQCYRVELCRFVIPEVDLLTACGDIESQVDQLLERHYPNELFPFEGEPALTDDDIESRRKWRRDGILFLLDGHPNPFDPVALIRQMGRLVADQIVQLQHRRFSWTAPLRALGRRYRQSRVVTRTRLWPAQFHGGVPFDCLGPSENARQQMAKLWEDLPSSYLAEMQPPSDTQLKVVRERLRYVPNALGVLVADALMPIGILSSEHRRRERLEATREALAAARPHTQAGTRHSS